MFFISGQTLMTLFHNRSSTLRLNSQVTVSLRTQRIFVPQRFFGTIFAPSFLVKKSSTEIFLTVLWLIFSSSAHIRSATDVDAEEREHAEHCCQFEL